MVTRRSMLRAALLGTAAVGLATLAGCGEPEVVTETKVETVTAEVPVVTDAWGVVTVKKGETVKIGFAAALSGDLANLGIDERNGATLAVEDNPEIKGFKVEMLAEDDLCSGEGGTAVANKFAANPQIVGMVGNMCSSSSIPASDIYERAHIPMISPSTTAVAFTARGLAVSNRVCWNDAIQGAEAAKFVFEKVGAKNAALIHDLSPYGKGLVDVFKEAFGKLGGTVLAEEGVTVGDKDFRAVLTTIAAKKPEIIYFGGFQTEGALLVAQKNEVGLKDAKFMGADGINSQQYIDAGGKDAEGSYSSFADFPTGSEAALAEFRSRYEKRWNVKPQDLGPFHAHAYDAMVVLLKAVDTASQVTPDGDLLIKRSEINNAIRATKDYKGVSGVISFLPNGDGGTGTVAVQIVKDGKWEKVG